jgi:hypothetical protein
MWWLWPHFRRIWTAAGAIAVGLAVNYLFALWGEQSVPSVQRLTHFLWDSWYVTGGVLILFAVVSVFAERAYRWHVAPHFIGQLHGRKGTKLPPLPSSTATASTLMVGREGELRQLSDWFASVLRGSRRVVFVSGEAGIGKTTFVNAFIDSLRREGVRIARGQCVEQYGAAEPYMPMLEALTQLGRGAGSQQLLAILHRLAPAWLAQLPALLTAEERARIQGETQGLTQQRMLREMAETLAALAAEAPLVVLLEDLHWSDASTLDLIAAVARRTEPARLLILGTYRPVEMLAGDHPLRALKDELEVHQQCQELRLKLLGEAEVALYLARRFASDGAQFSRLAPAIYQRTDGNALFMVNVVDYLVAQGLQLDASKIETPRNIRQMIERNLRRLDAEQQAVLESAGVAGSSSRRPRWRQRWVARSARSRPVARASHGTNNSFGRRVRADGPTGPSPPATVFSMRSIRKCFTIAHRSGAEQKRIAALPSARKWRGARAPMKLLPSWPFITNAAATRPRRSSISIWQGSRRRSDRPIRKQSDF